jgi:hypothetical protein
LERVYKDTIKCVKFWANVKVALEASTHMDSRHGNFKRMRLTVLSFRSLPIWNSTFAILSKRVCYHGGSSFHCRFHRRSFQALVYTAKTTYLTALNTMISKLLHFRNEDTISTISTIILPVVLYGCETWSLPLREEVG